MTDMRRIVQMAEIEEAKRMGYDPYYEKPGVRPEVNDPYRRQREVPVREDRGRDGRGRYTRSRMTYDQGEGRKVGFEQGMSEMQRKPRKALTMAEAEEWVEAMQNESDEYPEGPRWDVDEAEEIAEEFGIKPDTPKFAEFYAVLNMMYSDYAEVLEKFDLDEEEVCPCMAMAWIKDRDAERGKTKMYYDCIVKKEQRRR